MFFEHVIHLDDTVHPTLRQHFSGTFRTHDKWGAGTLELHLSDKGILTGSLTLEEITFGIKGQLNHTGLGFAYLLEPDAAIPIAMLRIKSQDEGLSINVHVPEFDDLMNDNNEPILFSRVARNNAVTTMILEELLIGA